MMSAGSLSMCRPSAASASHDADAAGAESVVLDARCAVVLQHVCLADRAVLSPMRDKTECWIVHRAGGASVKSMTYVPAVVSAGIAFHLAQSSSTIRYLCSNQTGA